MPSRKIMSASISKRREPERRSFSCTNSRPTTPIGSRRCATSRAATAASPIPRAAIRHPTCRRRPTSTPTSISIPTRSRCSITSSIAKAHFIGLSMGSYSSLQIGLNAPERALSMTLAAVGSGSNLENLDAFRKQCVANAEQYEAIGSVEVAKATREAPSRIPFLLKDPRGHADFYAALARHDAQGLGQHHAQLSGRPALDLHHDGCDPESADAGADPVRRRGRQLRRAEPVPEAASARGGAVVLSEIRPRAQSGGAGAVQRNGRAVHRAGRGRAVAGAGSEVDEADRHSGERSDEPGIHSSRRAADGFRAALRFPQ